VETLGDLLQQSGCNFLVGRVLLKVDRDENLLGFGIDIAHIDTSLLSEKDPVAITDGVDVDILFGIGRVRHERLDQELSENSGHSLDLLLLAGFGLNPLSGFGPCLVKGQETALASPLDQLIWLGNEFCTGSEEERIGCLSLVQNARDLCIFRKVDGRKFGRRIVSSGLGKRGRLDDGRASEVIVEDGLAVGFED